MNTFKKIICAGLTALFAFSAVFITAGKSSANYPDSIPIIFIHGEGCPIGTVDEEGEFHRIDNMGIDTGKLTSLLSENKEMLLRSFVTQDWTDFCDFIEEFMVESFGELALGNDGMPKDDAFAIVNWGTFEPYATEDYIRERYEGEDNSLNKYMFWYDWRLDPTDNMERLHDFADLILKVTGSEKYAIVGRCEGACLATTYWDTYHDPRISDIILYASALKGAIPIGEAFSGSMYVDPESIERFVYEADLNVNMEVTDYLTITDQTINTILKVASDMYGLDYACWAINNVYGQIYSTVTPKALRKTFATFPGFWAMCEDKYFEKAKEVMFGGCEDEYAGLIEKIDNYHYNIMDRAEEILQNAIDSGVEVSNVVKYGYQSYPLSPDSDVLSDQMCRVDYAGLGTTCTKVGETFSAAYINKATAEGNAKYISPDRVIDASTTMLKDTTWYVKNITHQNFTNAMDCIFFEIANTDGMTVETNPDYPQFMFFENDPENLRPFNVDEDKTKTDEYNEDVSRKISRFIKPIFKIVFLIITFITKALTLPARS